MANKDTVALSHFIERDLRPDLSRGLGLWTIFLDVVAWLRLVQLRCCCPDQAIPPIALRVRGCDQGAHDTVASRKRPQVLGIAIAIAPTLALGKALN